MENPPRGRAYIPNCSQIYMYFNKYGLFQMLRQGPGRTVMFGYRYLILLLFMTCNTTGGGSNRRVILCLGLLNVVMLIVAVVLGIKCAKVKDGSLHVSHSAAVQLLTELEYLRGNHSDVMEAAQEAKKTLETAVNNHTRIKMQIEQHKNISGALQKQIETLRAERNNLQTNISALDGTCGKCLPGWMHLNSSCYFFAYLESASVRKNWHESRADCVGRGADLVVIDNQDEQEFLGSCLKSTRDSPSSWKNGVWIGLTEIQPEGKWVWINNVTEEEQRYWMDGEPNSQVENCAIAVYSDFNPWKTRFDGNCQSHRLSWTCEKPSR